MKLNLLVINTLTIAVIYINGDNELLHDTKMLVTFMPSVAIPYPIQNGLTFRKGDMSTSSHTVGSRDEANCCSALRFDSTNEETKQLMIFTNYKFYPILDIYQYASMNESGSPVYKHFSGGDAYLFRSYSGNWWVGPEVGGNTGWVLQTTCDNISCSEEYTSGWKYTDGNIWKADPSNIPTCEIEKMFGNWTNVGKCIPTSKGNILNDFLACGPGNQNQTRNCTDGTTDECTMTDTNRTIPCSDAGSALPECHTPVPTELEIQAYDVKMMKMIIKTMMVKTITNSNIRTKSGQYFLDIFAKADENQDKYLSVAEVRKGINVRDFGEEPEDNQTDEEVNEFIGTIDKNDDNQISDLEYYYYLYPDLTPIAPLLIADSDSDSSDSS